MFQTELILHLQSMSSDVLTSFFMFWTTAGLPSWTIVILIVFLFGVNFRTGFLLMQAVLWCGIITTGLKEFFALPRPANVDINVRLLGKSYANPTFLESMGAESFFGGIPRTAVEALRQAPIDSWGFPSGHTSLATTFWGSLFGLYRKLWLRLIAGAMIVFIPLSRMYLGRHFLADILGGYAIGCVIIFLYHRWGFKNDRLSERFSTPLISLRPEAKTILIYLYFLLLPLLLLVVPFPDQNLIAYLFGANLGFLLLSRRGLPEDTGSIGQRSARILVAAAVFFGVDRFFEAGLGSLGWENFEIAEFFKNAAATFALLYISTTISWKIGLFRGREESDHSQDHIEN